MNLFWHLSFYALCLAPGDNYLNYSACVFYHTLYFYAVHHIVGNGSNIIANWMLVLLKLNCMTES